MNDKEEITWVFYDPATGDVVGHGGGPRASAPFQAQEGLSMLIGAQYQPNTKVVNGQVVPK